MAAGDGGPSVSYDRTTAALFVVVALLILELSGRDPGRYGIAFHQSGRALEAGLTSLAALGPLCGLVFLLLAGLGWSPYDWPGALILALGYGLAWPVVAYLLCKQPAVEERPASRGQIAGLLSGLELVTVLAAVVHPHTPLVSTALYTLFFLGIGEELFFRGYVQSRLNQAFDRPYHLRGASLGWEMPLAALVFGLSHVLSPPNPGQVAWGLWTFVFGLVMGHVREETGSFLAPAVAHGVLMCVAALLGGPS
ncbi:Abortive infection protein [Thermaerobacter marianensis DSM 12885]|uniref:Abortive infection protein n=1 Tax=Thermaerobacter marianensis (strain ATCC 700841 / DSM 12885 / JCM 10246 / 7p75a) TaxID=644966 RepID=E6SGT4_THEM7|nr:CPBP family intramembrane glutamic endopeptidase [Thermaerobacter marianensis]ADU51668.1 Abortive infection protein [Thermaerobacter marianensis DSM 12885]